MPHIVVRTGPRVFEAGFDRIREELGVPAAFPPEVLDEADRASPRPPVDGSGSAGDGPARLDARGLPLVAIDPPGATDLDQAVAIERRTAGYRVHYAIADVGAFVAPGGAVDAEARRRGTTCYSPDQRSPLHPPVISEDRASLLPGTDKPALLWTIDLDDRGEPVAWRMTRSVVRVRAAISYAEAQARIDASPDSYPEPASASASGDGTAPGPAAGPEPGWEPSLPLLAEVGRLRQAREADRGGISINLPDQVIVAHDGSYSLRFDTTLPVEGWNAQISLLTGMVAGRTMVDHGVGILRTLPAPDPEAVGQLRGMARALGLQWAEGVDYAGFVRRLAPNTPTANAFLLQATRTLRGAGYVGFDGMVPDEREHGAIASVYAHVTAPLRRLVDRFANEILLALFAGRRPAGWALDALADLPELMAQASRREAALERATLDYAEALVLRSSVGQRFSGVVIDRSGRRSLVQIDEPAVVAPVDDDSLHLGQPVEVELESADPDQRSIRFAVIRAGA